MKKALVWFRTDLRIHDNETLVRAIESNDQIIPVFCLDKRQFATTAFGFKKTGNIRAQFLLESLQDLDTNLRKLGSGLIVVQGKPEEAIPELAKTYQVQTVYSKKEVAYEEIQSQQLVEQELWKMNCPLETFSTSTLYHAQDLPFALKDIPDVFTLFRKQIEKESSIRNSVATPLVIPSPPIEPLVLPNLLDLRLLEYLKDERAVMNWKGGETEGLLRLEEYLFTSGAFPKYKETRSELIGKNYSSKFSAWLSMGCLSPRKIVAEIKKYEEQYEANESTYWLVFELIWRDYFRFMMKKYKHQFFTQNGIKSIPSELNVHNSAQFEAWKNGETGNDFIDANMKELKLTGFMSNRGRQNVASYLCHNLKLDWRYGAAYFEQQLIDYDVCSNWGNWAYLAGVGNDPRGKRIFNIEKQAIEYDNNKMYRNQWLTK